MLKTAFLQVITNPSCPRLARRPAGHTSGGSRAICHHHGDTAVLLPRLRCPPRGRYSSTPRLPSRLYPRHSSDLSSSPVCSSNRARAKALRGTPAHGLLRPAFTSPQHRRAGALTPHAGVWACERASARTGPSHRGSRPYPGGRRELRGPRARRHVRSRREADLHEPGRGPSPDTDAARVLTLNFSASGTAGNASLLFTAPLAVAFRDSDPNGGRRRQLGPRDVERGSRRRARRRKGTLANPGAWLAFGRSSPLPSFSFPEAKGGKRSSHARVLRGEIRSLCFSSFIFRYSKPKTSQQTKREKNDADPLCATTAQRKKNSCRSPPGPG